MLAIQDTIPIDLQIEYNSVKIPDVFGVEVEKLILNLHENSGDPI